MPYYHLNRIQDRAEALVAANEYSSMPKVKRAWLMP